MNNTRARVDVNLVGGIQFKHVKNCLMFKCAMIGCVLMMERELLGVFVVRKGAVKTRFT